MFFFKRNIFYISKSNINKSKIIKKRVVSIYSKGQMMLSILNMIT